jgi:anthranilate phosphoribosyltransferase
VASFAELGGWPGVLSRILAGGSLDLNEARSVIAQVLSGEATGAQIAALAVSLRAKGETVEEICGFVAGMLDAADTFALDPDVIDVVGTGGDRLSSINVTTLAAFIAAGAGARVCKHGGRAASSSVGSADVLEALGVAIELGPVGVTRCVAEVGMGFCFAPRFHPAMRHAGPVRRELGIPTVFNFLGSLSNPARVKRQLLGVSDPAMAPKMARVLGTNGSRRAMVVFADDGLDEISLSSPTTVLEVDGDGSGAFEVRTTRVEPGDAGLPSADLEDIRGGDAGFNASVIRRVLEGERSARRDVGVLNAAAALMVSEAASELAVGVALAEVSLDEGHALRVLDELVRVSQEARAAEAAPSN